MITAWLFGRSVLVNRATAALIALSGTLADLFDGDSDTRVLTAGADPVLDFVFDPPPGLISRGVIEIEDLDAPPATSVALGELALREP